MDIGALLIILALLVLVGLFISRPLLEKSSNYQTAGATPAGASGDQQSTLLAERDRIINTLKELDFDHALRKIPDSEYKIQREALVKQGAHVLQELEEFDSEPFEGEIDDQRDYEDQVQVRKQKTESSKEVTSEVATIDEVEMMLAEKRRKRNGKATGFCAQCGGVLHKYDTFCPKCGTKLG